MLDMLILLFNISNSLNIFSTISSSKQCLVCFFIKTKFMPVLLKSFYYWFPAVFIELVNCLAHELVNTKATDFGELFDHVCLTVRKN